MLGRMATAFELPVVLSTVYVRHGMSGTNPELREALPGVPEIDRTTMNSWEDPEFRAAVERTGRKKLIIAGLWTEVCVAFPTLDALRAGYEVYVVVDAIGGVSRAAHESAMQRMIQAGATPISVLGLACELQRDWGRPGAEQAACDHARVLRQAQGGEGAAGGLIATPRRSTLLLELAILTLRLLHRFRLQLLRVSIQPDEDAPTRKQDSHCEHQGGCIQQVRRSFVRCPEGGDEGFDGQCHDEDDKKPGQETPDPRGSADMGNPNHFLFGNSLAI